MRVKQPSLPLAYFISISSSTMRIAIYARKSTESEDRQVQSLGDQLQILHDIARREGDNIVEVISESKSAKEPGTRPGFQALMNLIQDEKIEGILTWQINRLTRNLVDGGQLAHLLASGKLQIIKTPERTFRSEDNVLLLAIENGVATSYIHDLRKNVRRGMDSKAAKGWKPGQAPLGYLNNWETREIDLDPVRAPIIRKGWEMLLTGAHSIAEIHRELIKLGLTNKRKSVRGTPITLAGLHKLFRNPFYCGRLHYKGQVLPGRQPAIVSEGEFELAQIVIGRLGNGAVRTREVPAFASVFSCGICGAAVVHERKTKKLATTGETITYSYYHCSGSKGCVRRSIDQDLLSVKAQSFARANSFSASFAKWCLDAVQNAALSESGDLALTQSQLAGSIQEEKRRLDSLTLKYIDGDVEKETYLRMKQQMEESIRSKESALSAACNREAVALEVLKTKLDAGVKASMYAFGNSQFRREVLKSLGGKHTWDGSTLRFTVDPIIHKIVTFEPGETSSQSPKSDDFYPDNQNWWSLVDDLRTTVQGSVHEGTEEEMGRL